MRIPSVSRSAALFALAASAPTQGLVRFTDATTASGINFVHQDLIDTMAGGVCLFDYDNDGWPDLYATSRGGGTCALFHNERNGTFNDVTSSFTNLAIRAPTMGAYAADLDNDGWQDLVVLTHGRLYLFRNDRNNAFTDVSQGSGAVNPYWATACTFGDYDRDGRLDIYIGNYIEDGFFPYFIGSANRLFHNEGNMRFTDLSRAAGVEGFGFYEDQRGGTTTYACTLSSLFFDWDDDGWPDLFVGNDFGPYIIPNLLYRNNRDGTFTEIGGQAGFRIREFNMGLATADVNGDGFVDLYTTNLGNNHLLLNDGRRLRDAAPAWNAVEGRSNGLLLTSWACIFLDADLDTRPDLYVSNGLIETVPALANDPNAPKHLLYNLGNTYAVWPAPLFPLDTAVGRGAARGDLDGDGDEDLIQLNNRSRLKVYRNDTPRTNAAISLLLQGSLSNRDGVGAKVTVRSTLTRQVFENNRGGSYLSCNAAPCVLGLGSEAAANEVECRWPSGVTSHLLGVPGNRQTRVVEPSVTITGVDVARAIGTDFIEFPVTLRNHAVQSEPVTLTTSIVWFDQRFPITSYSIPPTLGALATVTVPVYLNLPYQLLPLARVLGFWLQVNATSRTSGLDQVERPF